MFERFLKFFIDNSRMNYTLFFLVCAIGIYSYTKIPKEIFPSFELDTVKISGYYSGASIDILDKIAVREIEDEVKSIEGITDVSSIISPGRFTIILEIQKGKNKYDILAKVKDAVDIAKTNFPDDMDDPNVKVIEFKKALLDIAISSRKLTLDELKESAKDIKDKVLSIGNISEAYIYGDSDMFFNIRIDEKKVEALGIDKNSLYNALSKISYIFPLGKIEDSKKHYYISTYNGKKSEKELSSTKLKVGKKSFYLSEIAIVEKRHEDSATLSSLNGANSLTIAVSQSEEANAIELSKKIKRLIEQIQSQNSDFTLTIFNDNSTRIKDRLNIVFSNIMLGIILLTILMAVLINSRMSMIVALGIPTSFIMSAIYFYLFGYTINMISLVGVLIALGIVVDDAIVVSENIQQHIEKGMQPKEAALKGTLEMAKPVMIASLTTLFSFIPALMISGTMGEFIKLVPIAFSSLVLASLIESFLFLPIHAAHILKKDAKVLSWQKANRVYGFIIQKLMQYKKSFLAVFIIIVPILTLLSIKNSKFQMFPRFDTTTMNISIKADVNTKVEDMFKIAKSIEKDLLNKKDFFGIKHISTTAGFRMDADQKSENYPYVAYIKLELHKLKADNFVDKFITPYLSFYYDKKGRIRDEKSFKIAKKLRNFLIHQNYKEKFALKEIFVAERKAGPVKSDIKIGLISHDNKKLISSIESLKKEIAQIKGIKSIADSLNFGVDEIKIKVNSFGESLGVDEGSVGYALSHLFLSRKKSVAFDEKDMLDIKIESIAKDDISRLEEFIFSLPDGKKVALSDITDFEIIKSFEKVIKDNGDKTFYIYANVDPKIITASEVIEKIDPLIQKIEKGGVEVKILGENEKKKDLKNDLAAATALAMLLILLSLLYMFNSFKDTFIVMSVIPFSFLGVMIGHFAMGMNMSMPTMIGGLGLAGVVINDGIIMMTYLRRAKSIKEVFNEAAKRLRPIVLTSVTTLVGLATLIFFPTGQAVIFQPLAVALGFGLAWGTILNLLYLPVLFTFLNAKKLRVPLNS